MNEWPTPRSIDMPSSAPLLHMVGAKKAGTLLLCLKKQSKKSSLLAENIAFWGKRGYVPRLNKKEVPHSKENQEKKRKGAWSSLWIARHTSCSECRQISGTFLGLRSSLELVGNKPHRSIEDYACSSLLTVLLYPLHAYSGTHLNHTTIHAHQTNKYKKKWWHDWCQTVDGYGPSNWNTQIYFLMSSYKQHRIVVHVMLNIDYDVT